MIPAPTSFPIRNLKYSFEQEQNQYCDDEQEVPPFKDESKLMKQLDENIKS